MTHTDLKATIIQWLKDSDGYTHVFRDDISSVCMDGYFDLEELADRITESVREETIKEIQEIRKINGL